MRPVSCTPMYAIQLMGIRKRECSCIVLQADRLNFPSTWVCQETYDKCSNTGLMQLQGQARGIKRDCAMCLGELRCSLGAYQTA